MMKTAVPLTLSCQKIIILDIINRKPKTADYQPQTINHKLPTANYQPQTINRRLSTADYQPQTIKRKS